MLMCNDTFSCNRFPKPVMESPADRATTGRASPQPSRMPKPSTMQSPRLQVRAGPEHLRVLDTVEPPSSQRAHAPIRPHPSPNTPPQLTRRRVCACARANRRNGAGISCFRRAGSAQSRSRSQGPSCPKLSLSASRHWSRITRRTTCCFRHGRRAPKRL